MCWQPSNVARSHCAEGSAWKWQTPGYRLHKVLLNGISAGPQHFQLARRRHNRWLPDLAGQVIYRVTPFEKYRLPWLTARTEEQILWSGSDIRSIQLNCGVNFGDWAPLSIGSFFQVQYHTHSLLYSPGIWSKGVMRGYRVAVEANELNTR